MSIARALIPFIFAIIFGACSEDDRDPVTGQDASAQPADASTRVDCPGGCPMPMMACDTVRGICVAGCQSDVECTAPAPFCNPTTHRCSACRATSDCAPGSMCSEWGTCVVTCMTSQDCPPYNPVCDQTCGACSSDDECPGRLKCLRHPSLGYKLCTLCGESSDCPSDAPYCAFRDPLVSQNMCCPTTNVGSDCRACITNDDCVSPKQCAGGMCR